MDGAEDQPGCPPPHPGSGVSEETCQPNKPATQVSGSMAVVDDDDSESDSEDEAEAPLSAEELARERQLLQEELERIEGDDGFEEVELMVDAASDQQQLSTEKDMEPGGQQQEQPPPVTPPKTKQPASQPAVPSLVAAMAAAVAEVERDLPALSPPGTGGGGGGGSPRPPSASASPAAVAGPPPLAPAAAPPDGYGQGFGEGFELPTKRSQQQQASGAKKEKEEENEVASTADFFGLAYKKIELPKKDNQALKGPAFNDEREFEKELSEEFTGKVPALASGGPGGGDGDDDDDDEFEFGEGEGGGGGGQGGGALGQVDLAEAARRRREREALEQARVVEAMKRDMEKEQEELKKLEEQERAKAAPAAGTSQEQEEDIYNPNKALDTIKHSYSGPSAAGGAEGNPSLPAAEATKDSGGGAAGAFSGIYVKDDWKEGAGAAAAAVGAGAALAEEPLANTALKARPLTDFVFKEEDEEEYEEREAAAEAEREAAEARRREAAAAAAAEERRLREEWEAVEQLRTAEREAGPQQVIGVGGVVRTVDADLITYREALAHFQALDMGADRGKIVPLEAKTGLKAKMQAALLKKHKLKWAGAGEERDWVFLVAQQHYAPDNPVYRRVLQTIYKRLTGSGLACPDLGSHWDLLGFQGNNPETDLNRSQGMLSLLQALWLTEHHREAAARYYRASREEPLDWPFILVAVGFTKECVGTMRRAQVYPECNRARAVLPVLNDLYLALFDNFYRRVRRAPATHHAEHLAALRRAVAAAPAKLLKEHAQLRAAAAAAAGEGAKRAGGGAGEGEMAEF